MARSRILPESPHSTPLVAVEREFYQRRVAIYGLVGFAFVAVNAVIYLLLYLARGSSPGDFFGSAVGQGPLVNLMIFGATWGAGRWRGIPWSLLRFVDAACVIGCGLVFTFQGVADGTVEGELILAGALFLAVMARSVVIPDRAGRTAVIALLAVLPLHVVGFVSFEDSPAVAYDYTTFVIRGLMGVVLATIVSWVVYDLVRKVRQAEQLGQYRLEEKIGAGGMGEVYRASHALLRRPTAIKLLPPERAGDENLARFEREVQLTSQLSHPHTIAIYDFGHTPEGTFYYAMEFLDGRNLEEIVAESGPLPPGRIIHILRQVCGSLVEAHAAGLIHRDVKTANVILCVRGGLHDFVKVVDFGLVKETERPPGPGVTAADVVTGTPLFMAPEAVSSPDRVDARSDLYSLGAVGYVLLTGAPLFEGESAMEICAKQYSELPVPPRERVDFEVPGDLEEAIMACLAKDPTLRPRSAQAFEQLLGGCAAAGSWTDEDARGWWERHRVARTTAAPPPVAQRGAVTVDLDDASRC